MTGRRQERGIALVVVLWVGLLLAAISGAFILDTRTSARLTRKFVDNAQARALADGGVHLAMFEILHSDAHGQWRRDGRRYRRAVAGGALEISIEDEAGKINLNRAGDELLEGLFLSTGMEPSAAREMVETVAGIRSGNETRDRSFRSAGVPADKLKPLADAIGASRLRSTLTRSMIGTSRSAPGTVERQFIVVDALGQLPGITADLYARLRPALTVYGNSGRLNYLNAPREALQAVPGVSAETIDIFLTERMSADTPEPLNELLAEGRARDFWQGRQGNFVTVKVLAQADNGAKFARIAVVEIRQGSGVAFFIREWREGDATMFRPELQTRQGTTMRQEGVS